MTPASGSGFPKYLRLTSGSDFQRVYKRGQKVRSLHFTLFLTRNQLPYSRFGFTASKRVGNAVQRNRVKRLFREAIRLQKSSASPGFDFVFNPHPSALKLKSTALRRDVASVFIRVKKEYAPAIGHQDH